jgi:hypothetical protein
MQIESFQFMSKRCDNAFPWLCSAFFTIKPFPYKGIDRHDSTCFIPGITSVLESAKTKRFCPIRSPLASIACIRG